METLFVDDPRYAHWLRDHPDAHVARLHGDDPGLVVHEAGCDQVAPGDPAAGGMVSVRVCVESTDDLAGWGGQGEGESPTTCPRCDGAPDVTDAHPVRREVGTKRPIVMDVIGASIRNPSFRRIVVTGEHSRLVLMNIPAGGQIEEETHEDVDQVLVVVAGSGEAILDGWDRNLIEPGSLVFVPAGTNRTLVNGGDSALKLYSLYAFSEHASDSVDQPSRTTDGRLSEAHGGQ